MRDFLSDTYLLEARDYPYPNTVFNTELGARVAEGLATRVHASPHFERFLPALFFLAECYGEADFASQIEEIEDAAAAPHASSYHWESIYPELPNSSRSPRSCRSWAGAWHRPRGGPRAR